MVILLYSPVSFRLSLLCLLYYSGVFFAGMLDHIVVETGGVKMPLNHLALVSVLDPKTLSVNPYDPDVISPHSIFFLFLFIAAATLD